MAAPETPLYNTRESFIARNQTQLALTMSQDQPPDDVQKDNGTIKSGGLVDAAGDFEYAKHSQNAEQVASIFQDDICGEPLKAQSFKLDFTPITGVDDNEILIDKCLDFWEFVYSQPELQKLIAVGKKTENLVSNADHNKSITSVLQSPIKAKASEEELDEVEWMTRLPLELLVEGPKDYCEGPPQDYWSSASTSTGEDSIMKYEKSADVLKSVFQNATKSATQEKYKVVKKSHSPEDVRKLCRDMERFDEANPKSFDPPGRPIEKRAITQRLPY